jgi:hypothetical protein
MKSHSRARLAVRLFTLLSSLVALTSVAVPSIAYAIEVQCRVHITGVQTEYAGAILAEFDDGGVWHTIALDTNPGRADRLSVLLAAMLSGTPARISFPSGYSCSVASGTEATAVRIEQ